MDVEMEGRDETTWVAEVVDKEEAEEPETIGPETIDDNGRAVGEREAAAEADAEGESDSSSNCISELEPKDTEVEARAEGETRGVEGRNLRLLWGKN